MFAFLGPNGAGKTTTVEVIETIGTPTSGKVTLLGMDVTKLYLVFFALPLLGLNVPILVAGMVALMVNSSAFMAEIVRADIQAVGKDQLDAARGLGMNYVQTMRHVVIPQAFRVMIPTGVGLLIGLIKDSSIVSVISYIELTRVEQILTEKTFLSFQVFGIVAALYFAMCYPLSRLALYAERRLKVGG